MALKLGSHVSLSEGLLGAAKGAANYNADTFMIYTGPPQNTNLGANADNPRGMDYIGREAIYRIVNHPVVDGKALILETPWLDKSTSLYKEEIDYLRGPIHG